jgi:hypothetical protein
MTLKTKIPVEKSPIQVGFHGGIDMNGDITLVTISKLGNTIQLTKEQAQSLAKVITAKFGT